MRLQAQKLCLERTVTDHEHLKARTSSALCGHHLTDAEWHRKHPRACKQYFLFHDFNFDHSPVMLGRASETLMVKHMALNSSPLKETFISDDGKEFVREWPRRLGKIPKGTHMLVDRGFARHSVLYPNKNFHLFPSFAGKRLQFTKAERGKDKQLCKLRWVNKEPWECCSTAHPVVSILIIRQ